MYIYACIHNTFLYYCILTFHFTEKLSKASPDADAIKYKSNKYE